MIELHTLLDDGEPHCSCGESFRGLPYSFYEDHARRALRLALNSSELERESLIKFYGAALDEIYIHRALAAYTGVSLRRHRLRYKTIPKHVRTLMDSITERCFALARGHLTVAGPLAKAALIEVTGDGTLTRTQFEAEHALRQ